MRYKVALYKLQKPNIKRLGEIIVEKNSLGVFEIVSGKKIRVTSGMLTLKELSKIEQPFIISSDCNGSNLVVPKNSVKGVYKKRHYDHERYVKEHKKIKLILK